METTQLPPPAQLMKMIVGKWLSKPIYVAAELGIADLLADGPRSITELARVTQTHPPTLYRIMRALASIAIFSEKKDRYFELTPLAELLKSGKMRSMALMFNAVWNDQAWQQLSEGLKSGQTPFEIAHGKPLNQWLERNPQAATVLNAANAIKAASSHRAIVDVYDFDGIDKLLDVGGGYGTLMIEILKANPSLRGMILDLPPVVRKAREVIHQHGLSERCEAVQGDFFNEVPAGCDTMLLSHILHDWPDEKCQVLLQNCHRALQPGSRLIIAEMIVPPGNEPSLAKLLDLEMLVITGGRERTVSEFSSLLESSGFQLSRIIPTGESICVIEGIREG